MSEAVKFDAQGISNEELFKLLGEELQRRLPLSPSSPEFLLALQGLPPGLRAMASTYELDVSLTMDDLGWHFGNWHSHPLAEETVLGLKELEATELASLFRKAYEHAKAHWESLGTDDWSDWYPGSTLEKELDPLNEAAYSLLEGKWNGIFEYWVAYARKYPERIEFKHDA
jgi:hypothetical protein